MREAGYTGTRVRLQRNRDAKFFNGWVLEMSGCDASILLNDVTSIDLGDFLAGEVNGRDNLALIEGLVIVTDCDKVKLKFSRPPRYEATREKFRTLVRDVQGTLDYQGEVVDLEVLDVSEAGLGLLSYAPIQAGSHVKLSLETPHGPIHVEGNVRYSRSDPQRFGLYRSGLQLDPMSRLDRARWHKLIGLDN